MCNGVVQATLHGPILGIIVVEVKGGFMPKGKTLSAIEAARLLGVGLDYLYGLLWTGKLQAQKVGRVWRVSSSGVEARLRARQKVPSNCRLNSKVSSGGQL